MLVNWGLSVSLAHYVAANRRRLFNVDYRTSGTCRAAVAKWAKALLS